MSILGCQFIQNFYSFLNPFGIDNKLGKVATRYLRRIRGMETWRITAFKSCLLYTSDAADEL